MIALSLLAFVLVGHGFSVLFLPSKLRSNTLLFAPWMGIVFIIYSGLALNLGRVAMNEELLVGRGFRGFQFIILLAIIATLYAAFYFKRKFFQFKKSHLLIFFFSLVILTLLQYIPIKKQMSIITSSNYLLEQTITDTLLKTHKVSNNDLLIGIPLVIAFLRSIYPFISIELLSQIANFYVRLIIYAGIFICSLIFLKEVVINNSIVIRGSELLFVIFMFALFSINIPLGIITLLLLLLYSIYQTYDKKSLLPLYKTGIIVLLLLLINPLYTGLLLHLYFP